MFYRILILVVSISALLFAAGCVTAATGSRAETVATVAVSDGVTGPPLKDLKTRTPAPPATGGDVVTRENAASGVTLRVGERFLLNLGDPGWIVQVGDESIIASVNEPNAPPGSQGYFEALKPGKTAMTATSDPPCAKAKPPCMMPTILLEIPVTVLP